MAVAAQPAQMNNFWFSDGPEQEAYLLQCVRQAKDLRSSSPELRKLIRDWPSEYHLSAARRNLLMPFAITLQHKVLEIGSGAGAITRYVGEQGASVVSLEGSAVRANICAERCRDLPNVKVVNE